MIELPAVRALNHLLQSQAWARDKLRPCAGRVVLMQLAPLPDLRLRVTESGLVDTAPAEAPADLTVAAPATALLPLLAGQESALAQVQLTGPVDLATTVQLLFRELKWDVEEDLSRVFGDVLAHRITGTARDLVTWQKDAALRLAQNVAEYATEERAVLVSGADAAGFRRNVELLAEQCDRLESRLARLESPTAPRH